MGRHLTHPLQQAMYSLLAIAALVAVAFAELDNDCDYYEYQSGGSCIRRVPCRTYQWTVSIPS